MQVRPAVTEVHLCGRMIEHEERGDSAGNRQCKATGTARQQQGESNRSDERHRTAECVEPVDEVAAVDQHNGGDWHEDIAEGAESASRRWRRARGRRRAGPTSLQYAGRGLASSVVPSASAMPKGTRSNGSRTAPPSATPQPTPRPPRYGVAVAWGFRGPGPVHQPEPRGDVGRGRRHQQRDDERARAQARLSPTVMFGRGRGPPA